MMMTAFQLRLETIMDLRQFHLEEQEMLLLLEEEEAIHVVTLDYYSMLSY